ncbi:transporter substrate-binding domain-containing protein [Massilia sp. S19_KUP03_FR1]|uniref:transporter substrate-binding domain-containing protein n=1 Tax=Massilia sp. S19_KUP03_FR1 TaxID=3025503 RepID=UPI002FCD7A94
MARRLVLASATLLFALSSLPSGAADRLAAIKKRGTLRVAMEGSYPPFNFVEPKTGQITGYDADVARLIGERLDLKVELIPTPWTDILDGLVAGKYDVIVSQVIISPLRARMVDFSEPYTYSGAQLIVRNDDETPYTRLADLKGKTVGVAKGSVYELQARAVAGVTVRSYPAAPENLQDLAFGRIDAALNDSLMVAWLAGNSTLPIKPGPLVWTGNRIGVAIQKGNPALKAAIDLALAQAQADGSLTRLSRKWFKIDASRPYP